MNKRLERDFYVVDSYNLGLNLLGKVIYLNNEGSTKRYRIVEAEAYGGAVDRAAHSYNNLRSSRTEVLYYLGGFAYVYLIYGIYYMFNIVANLEDKPECVLIRAVEPLSESILNKTNGPGKLCKHLGIDKSFDRIDLVTSDLVYLVDDGYDDFEIIKTKRIGIDYAGEDKDLLYRFYIKNNNHVSRI